MEILGQIYQTNQREIYFCLEKEEIYCMFSVHCTALELLAIRYL